MRWLRLLLGATAPAASATLVAFFAGHALGAAWAGRRAARWPRPLAAYGALELAAALAAAATPLLLRAGEALVVPAYDALRTSPAALTTVRLGIAGMATIPAAFCFGATFPTLGAAVVGPAARLGGRGSALYAVNTAGAAAGTALAVFAAPARLGISTTYGLALAALVAVGVGALALDRRGSVEAPAPAGGATAERRPARAERTGRGGTRADGVLRGWTLLALAALSGFGAFALQVLLVQSFAQVMNQSVVAFGAVLIGVLVCLALGAAGVAVLERRLGADPLSTLGFALVASALAALAFPAWLERVTDGLSYVGGGGRDYALAALGTTFAAAGPLLLAISLVLPLTWTLGARLGAGGAAPAAPLLGRLLVANTAGAVAGALAAPYLLMPRLGPWGSFVAISLAYALGAVLLPEPRPRRRLWRDGLLAIGWMALLLRASPLALPVVRTAPGERILAGETTPAGVVAVVERDGERLMRIDNHYALGGTAERVHQERQGLLPRVLAPGAERWLYVGSATGISAGATRALPLERLVLVELVPGVARAARTWFAHANRGVYGAPETRLVLDDARNFVRTTGETYDAVVADLFVPWRAGTGSLYTLEHFRAVRERLAAGGVFCQWLPLYQLTEAEVRIVAATFTDVFPRAALYRGDFFGRFPIAALVGWRDAVPEPGEISAAAAELARAGEGDRWVTDPLGPWTLYAGPLAPAATGWGGVARNRDDRPIFEWLAARSHSGGGRGVVDPAVGSTWTGFVAEVQASAARLGDPIQPDLPEPARRAAAGGTLLQRAGALWVEGRTDAAARAFQRGAALLPADLVAGGAPDPTAAELWGDGE